MRTQLRESQGSENWLSQFLIAAGRFWSVAKLYWFGPERWRALGLLTVAILMLGVSTALGVFLNGKRGEIVTALAERNESSFGQAVLFYLLTLIFFVPLFASLNYLFQLLGLFWRRWLTDFFLGGYFRDRSYYKLASEENIDNPDQRISQDVRSFTQLSLFYFLIFASALFDIVGYGTQLWSISPWLVGFLAIYSAIGIFVVTGIFGKVLVRLNFEQLKREANFRFGLVRLRENAEPIAFYRGEQQEKDHLDDRFTDIFNNFRRLILWRELGLGSFTNAYRNITFVLPYLILAPRVLNEGLELGQVDAARGAFLQVFLSLNLIVDRFEGLTEFGAGIDRVCSFERVLRRRSSEEDDTQQPHIDILPSQEIALTNVTLQTPNYQRTLVRNLDLTVPGHGLLIVGASGCGKSSLLRAIAGLWDSGSGKVQRPDLNEILFLPQRPYMVLGTLRDQLLYPSKQLDLSDDDLQQVLEQVNLPDTAARSGGLDAQHNWSEELSLGEQQRLAFARILTNKPRYVILDESTSALDTDNEEHLYSLLQESGVTYVSVGHRPTLRKFHQLVLELSGDQQWHLQPAGTSEPSA
ncbi:ABC-type uncharacterized transport system, permease and ATPase component [Rubidibacter lacunae KORDI 51-2]|uniref:ABC-type uncharacterized transport system, permease and ATPase component n=1 Tax=Rubidibacter lacunae KORDI 51-2 TaxID=582515 RepID=U5DNF3_9CHRO|nr:ABC transporter ATP-binding protein/permease [Rubidibacter lacunae]ERN42402.1 ABC-type uncharacterized transport system, permease and ATPase component [Rubidibacter lacunae KORDI 51-2]